MRFDHMSLENYCSYTADTLSRAPQECLVQDAELLLLLLLATTSNKFPTITDSLETY